MLTIAKRPPEAEFTLYTNASWFAVGAVLLLQDQGQLKPVTFYTRKMNKHEMNYPIHEQELLALKEILQHFRCHLEVCRKKTLLLWIMPA